MSRSENSSSVQLVVNDLLKSCNYYRFGKRAEMTQMVSLIKLIQKSPEVVLILCFYWVQQCIQTCYSRGQVLADQAEVAESCIIKTSSWTGF